MVEALQQHKNLFSLRLSNTHVSVKFVEHFWNFVKDHESIKVFRWINLDNLKKQPFVDYEPHHIIGLEKMMCLEYRLEKVNSGVYLNPYVGDLTRDLVEGVFKCQQWTLDSQELLKFLASWCDFAVDNFNILYSGKYK